MSRRKLSPQMKDSWILPDWSLDDTNDDVAHDSLAGIQSHFQTDGFAILASSHHRFLSEEACYAVQERIPLLFRGQFETGIYPDEWHWRQGISLPHVTREICNAWKSDPTIASIVLSEKLAKFVAMQMQWDSVRIAQDDLIWKPPSSVIHTNDEETTTNKTVVGFHQDSAYISSQFTTSHHRPSDNISVTVWMALDDVDGATGSVEYAVGSHKWERNNTTHGSSSNSTAITGEPDDTATPTSQESSFFHDCTAENYKRSIPTCPNSHHQSEVVSTVVKQGHAILHHQDVWHGSGPNRSSSRHRRALVVHYIRGDVQFRSDRDEDRSSTPWGPSSYIYGRYRRFGSTEVDENFFPIVFAAPQSALKRTSWVDDYIVGAVI